LTAGHDAIVIGSGPNGLAAAVELARAGLSVQVREGADVAGGGLRSGELTLPGYVHDLCSAVHPLGAASPFFRSIPLAEHGVDWIDPPLAVSHPLDGGRAASIARSVDETATALGRDGDAYRRLFSPFVQAWRALEDALLGPLLRVPRHPLALARFGLPALRSASGFARARFDTDEARGLFAGLAAHSILPLEHVATASFGLVFGTSAHAVGWPVPRGGSQRLADALVSYLGELGGEVVTGAPVESLRELEGARVVMADVTPRQFLRLAGEDRLPGRYRRALERFRHGPGVYKLDWALDEPIPWAAPECTGAGTVHLGGTLDELAASERAPWDGRVTDDPFVLLAQPSLFDDSRAPPGKHTGWAYSHVPNGWTGDLTETIERQVERFAPGFRDVIAARNVMTPADLERHNPNLVGGDITGGAQTLLQLVARPALRPVPYSTPLDGVFICSSSTPPGGGVHGMCGFFAARAALRRLE
jgi:phytoene dehydrogenase-like protein